MPRTDLDPDRYLDHAATSWPKPAVVSEAVLRWFDDFGVSADRGESERSEATAVRVQEVRSRLADLCSVPTERIAFTSGATESLHLAFRALLRDGDRVVTTETEHSSVVRPLRALPIELEVVRCDGEGRVDPAALIRSLDVARTRLVVLNHASNVTGAVQDIEPVLRAARERQILSLVDASQTFGQIDCRSLGADFLVASAHKSLLGPPGLGLLAVDRHFDEELKAPKPGGSGSSLALDEHPTGWPTLFEAGTPNTPAIFGLGAALDWAADRARDAEESAEESLARSIAELDRFATELQASKPKARIWRPAGRRLPVLSFVLPDLDPAEAGMLASSHGFHLRTGFHCAPWIHRALGTEREGTVRISLGPMQTGAALSELVSVWAH